MSRKILLVVGLLLTPILAVGGYIVFVAMMVTSMGAAAGCAPSSGTVVPAGSTEPALEVRTTNGTTVTLDGTQLENARRIITVGESLGVPPEGLVVSIVTALQESRLYNYANTSAYPESANYPHDRDGSDHDSVGVFQQRPSAGWGTVRDLMDVNKSARAFFGGPDGPNGGSPRGLLDIPGWQAMTPGEAAQAVQVSAFPSAYDKWVPAAQTIVARYAGSSGNCAAGSGQAALPLAEGFNMTEDFGPRPCPIPLSGGGCGASTWHVGVDLQNWPNACGDPVYAVLPGTVVVSSALTLSIRHPDGFVISYLHMYKSQRFVDVGDRVETGQQVGVVGNVAPSTGCHLDLRINVTGTTNASVASLPQDARMPGWVNPEDFMRLYGVELCPAEWCSRQY